MLGMGGLSFTAAYQAGPDILRQSDTVLAVWWGRILPGLCWYTPGPPHTPHCPGSRTEGRSSLQSCWQWDSGSWRDRTDQHPQYRDL